MRLAGRAALLFAALAATSCGGDAPVTLGDAPITLKQAEGIVTSGDIKAVGGDASGLEHHVEDIRAFVETVDPTRVEDVRAMYTITFARGDEGSVVAVAVHDYTSTARAEEHMGQIGSPGAFAPLAEGIGERAYGGETTIGGPGAMVAFIAGPRVVIIQSSQLNEDGAILTPEQVEVFARRIAPRF